MAENKKPPLALNGSIFCAKTTTSTHYDVDDYTNNNNNITKAYKSTRTDSPVEPSAHLSAGSKTIREPVDPSRYIIVRGSDGAMLFECVRCANRYAHRKSLNKHWNDKHGNTGDKIPEGSGKMVKQPRPAHLALLSTTGVGLLESGRAETESFMPPAAHTANLIGGNVLQKNQRLSSTEQEYFINSMHSPGGPGVIRDYHGPVCLPNNFIVGYDEPVAAHMGWRRLSDPLHCSDVLDLSKTSMDSRRHSLCIPTSQEPLDFSVKSQRWPQINNTDENVFLPPMNDGATFSYNGNKTVVVLPRAPEEHQLTSRTNDFDILNSLRNSPVLTAHDSIAVLRNMYHSLLSLNGGTPIVSKNMHDGNKSAEKRQVSMAPQFCQCGGIPVKDVSMDTDERQSHSINSGQPEPNCRPVSSIQTHEYFGGTVTHSRIRCKSCNFLASSMLHFSQHISEHINKVAGLKKQGDSHGGKKDRGQTGKFETDKSRFFEFLGLVPVKSPTSDIKDSHVDRCSKCGLEFNTNTHSSPEKDCFENSLFFKCLRLGEGGSGSVSLNDEHVSKLTSFSSSNPLASISDLHFGLMDSGLQQQPRKQHRPYIRGLGLTTTESETAAGRSCRMRRLRRCERCGYVTDNLTTLKRHESKHGAVGAHQCPLCDYAVNQLHTMHYHLRKVHGQTASSIKLTGASLGASLELQGSSCSLEAASDTTSHNSSADADVKSPRGNDITNEETGRKSQHTEGENEYINDADSRMKKSVASKHTCKTRRMHSGQKQHGHSRIQPSLSRYQLLDSYGLRPGRGMCIRCGFRSLSDTKMMHHLLTHPDERITCASCGHRSTTKRLLKLHTRNCHTEVRARTSDSRRKMYPCSHCPFVAASPMRLQQHTSFHGVSLRHVCGTCSYSIDRMNLILQHRRLHVTDEPAKIAAVPRLHCSVCPFKTISRRCLSVHARGHCVTARRHVCIICGFGTDVQCVMARHRQVHSIHSSVAK